jgi:hypothetical protein
VVLRQTSTAHDSPPGQLLNLFQRSRASLARVGLLSCTVGMLGTWGTLGPYTDPRSRPHHCAVRFCNARVPCPIQSPQRPPSPPEAAEPSIRATFVSPSDGRHEPCRRCHLASHHARIDPARIVPATDTIGVGTGINRASVLIQRHGASNYDVPKVRHHEIPF